MRRYIIFSKKSNLAKSELICQEDFYFENEDLISFEVNTNAPLIELRLSSSNEILVVKPEGKYFNGSCFYDSKELTYTLNVSKVKRERALLLEQSDWTDTLSFKQRHGDSVYQQWQDYRQALRDITLQEGFPLNVTWPAKPE